MKSLKQLSILTSLAAVSLLTGCDIAEDTCTTDTDCAEGETCQIAEGSADANICVAAEGSGSGSGSGSGADTCATDADCAAGEQCDNSACGAIVYQHVAIVSLASADLGTPNGTPGPDLDAVAVVRGGVPSFATSAPVLILGGFSVGKPNENDTKADILGPNDVLTDTSGLDCIDPDGHSEYLSLGYKADPQGLVVLAMPNPISATDTISVYEVGNDYCRDITTTRDDAYDVYVGPRDIDAAAINDLNSLSAQGFIKLGGSSGQIGEIFNISAENIRPAQ